MKIFGFKIFTPRKYQELTNAIIQAGKMVRKHEDPKAYHSYGITYRIPASDFSSIYHIENCVWDDVKSELEKESEVRGEWV